MEEEGEEEEEEGEEEKEEQEQAEESAMRSLVSSRAVMCGAVMGCDVMRCGVDWDGRVGEVTVWPVQGSF